MFQDKTQTAENGPFLLKGCNAVLGHLGTSLRASWEAVVRGIAALGKDRGHYLRAATPRSTTSQLAELAVITWKDH